MSSGGFNHHASGLMTSIISEGYLGNMLVEARKIYQVRSGLLWHALATVSLKGQSEAAYRVLKEQLPSAVVMEPQVSPVIRVMYILYGAISYTLNYKIYKNYTYKVLSLRIYSYVYTVCP